jgi:ATP/maltotriose-dependent transcriptional regulator MalT
MSASVVGRQNELAAVEAFLGSVEEGPRALVLSGEAGIGKTILWEIGVAEAERRWGRVLAGRGSEAEASLSFAGLSDLLGPIFDDVAPSLLPPRRRALEIALLRVEPAAEPPDPHAIGLAVLDALSALARRGPVLVALDDVQWLDPVSAGAVQIALRRLREERVGLLATVRTGPELANPLELGRSYTEGRLEQLAIGPLSLATVHNLLKERLGLELTRPELARVHEATAGNPFFALEVGRELVRTGARPTPGQPLRVPESLRELLGDRIARLPGETLDVLLQAAALARPNVEVLTAAHGHRDRVLQALETAVREGVVTLDDSQIRFAHPLLASICYEEAPIWKRRAVHQALADAVSDVEERARHLALASKGPDESVASALELAAEQAVARGASAAASELSELAAERTLADSPAQSRRRLRAAQFARVGGDMDRAVALLERLRDAVPSGPERADVLFELALTQRGSSPMLIEQCNEALAAAPDDDFRATRILAVRGGHHLLRADVKAALVDIRASLARAERTGDPALLAQAIAYAGQAETYNAEMTPGLLERGAEIEARLGLPLEWNLSPRYVLGRRLMRTGDIDGARDLLEQVGSQALERGDEVSRLMVLWALTIVEWVAGRWDLAHERASAAYELTQQTQHPHALVWVGRAKALVEADLGLVEDARASAEESLAFSRATSSELGVIAASSVFGRLELQLGNLDAAGRHLDELPAQLLAGGLNDPTHTVWADAIEVLVARREFDRARAYLEPYEAHAARLGSPWALAAADRCRGLLSEGEDEPSRASEAFERSLTHSAAFPLERARTLLCLGMTRRRAQQKKAARQALEQALAIFEELGARLWAEKAEAELRRISGRTPATEELTETERRVAELAAQGRTNREIAAELYMGLSTVESHLSHVYRKLGVRRAGLAARLGTSQGAPAKAGGEPFQT